jgi:small subunit ribosomal protein S6
MVAQMRSQVQKEDTHRMKTYEFIVIFVSDENQLREGREFVKKEFESAGITITKEEDMGDRLLAYSVKKNDRGHYMVYSVQCTSEPLKNLSKTLKLRPEILKFLFTRQGV